MPEALFAYIDKLFFHILAIFLTFSAVFRNIFVAKLLHYSQKLLHILTIYLTFYLICYRISFVTFV